MAASKASAPAAKPARAASPAGRKGRVDADQVIGLFPESMAGWRLTLLEKPLPSPVPEPGAAAVRAEYAQGSDKAEVLVVTGLASTGAKGTRQVHGERLADRQENRVSISLPNGLLFVASSGSADAPALQALLEALDLARAQTLRPTKR